ncbi:hypothetical protein [Aestuariivirga sp.]|uniref:hypothetical protein n=1 Tax=Aestuariivirga sp. TaxID=2650926 RepID=UPI0039E4BDBF
MSNIPVLWVEEFEELRKDESSFFGSHFRRGIDWSMDSLKLIDSYLEELHNGFARSGGIFGRLFRKPPLNGPQVEMVVHLTGAYVGEVIRKHCMAGYNWYPFEDWISKNPSHVEYLGTTAELGTVFVLGNADGDMCLPFAKVVKFLHNGREDSVYFFAQAMAADNQKIKQ